MNFTKIVILLFILTQIIIFTGCKEKLSSQPDIKLGASFEELWNRYTSLPNEYEISWTDEISKIDFKEFRKGNNWKIETKDPFDINEDIYHFLLDGKAYACKTINRKHVCLREVWNDVDIIHKDQFNSFPSSMLENSRNFNDPVFDILKDIPKNKSDAENPLSKFQESVDDLKIIKTSYEWNKSLIDCYQFNLTTKPLRNARSFIEELEKMRDQSATEEDKRTYDMLIEITKQESEKRVIEIKVCFNQYNILTYSNKMYKNITDEISELNSFSVIVDDSVFKLPYPADIIFSDVIKTNNTDECHKLKDKYVDFLCVTTIAVNSNNPSICLQINDSWGDWMPDCLDRFVKNGHGYFTVCPAFIGYSKTDVCAVPVACLDTECSQSINMGYKIYPKCDQNPDCGFRGADELVKPICKSYQIRGENSSEDYQLCV